MSKVKEGFLKRNIVMVVMVPMIGALHYSWQVIQKNELLVPEEERRQLQIFDWYEHISKILSKEK